MSALTRRLTIHWFIVITLALITTACASAAGGQAEILIGLTVQSAPLVRQPRQPDPADTGLPSLDALNRHWAVQAMIPLFPDMAPDDAAAVRNGLASIYKLSVPAGTNLDAMLQAYEADPNIAYAELNQPAETK